MANNISAATLATLDEAERELAELGKPRAEDEQHRNHLMQALMTMTATFQSRTNKIFQPRPETRYFDATCIAHSGPINGGVLSLDQELYELTAIVNGDGSTLGVGQYTLLPRSGPPYTRIQLVPGALRWLPDGNLNPIEAISVSGIWVGGRPHSGQWLAVDVLNGDIGISTTRIAPVWLDNVDPFGMEPRFSRGQLLRIRTLGVSEYLVNLDTSFDLHQLDVRRGERNTTAIEHRDQDAIEVWWVDVRVAHAVARGAAYLYQRRGYFQASEYDPATQITTRFSGVLPKDVEDVIADYSTPVSMMNLGAV